MKVVSYIQTVFAVKNRSALIHPEWEAELYKYITGIVRNKAFSYSHSALDKVIQYIQNQKEHHKEKTFKNEYLSFLKKFEVEFKDEYLFEWIDE